MTPLQLLAAKVRGADDNVRGAEIIAAWYDEQTKHAIQLANSSARDVSGSPVFGDGLRDQLAKNFSSVAELLNIENQKKEL